MTGSKDKNPIFMHEWTTLRTLWFQISPAVGGDNALGKELTEYFSKEPPPPEKGGWEGLNRAEQIVGMYLDPVRLNFEFGNLMQLARSRKLPSLATFENYEKHLFQDPTSTTASEEVVNRQRVAYFALLYALQSGFVEDRFERQIKGATAKRLSGAGSLLLVLIVLRQTAQEIHDKSRSEDVLSLVTVIGMGVVGAFFSRLTRFQTDFSGLRFAEITNNYRIWVLVVRLLCGGIGAIIFYYLLRSGMLKSAVLPDWAALDMSRPSSDPKLTPVTEWSKILVWSFLAGFSERLVSSSLDKIGSK
jgi:hypothetical protein